MQGDWVTGTNLTPVLLAELYQQMGDRQIAALYGVTKPTVRNLRIKWGIAPLSKTDRSNLNVDVLTEEQKEICIGTILGDGHIKERGVLKVTHSQSQMSYLRRMHSLLSPLTLPIFFEEKKMEVSGQVAYAFGFHTKQHPWFKHMREVFYPEGVKVFPESILHQLTTRSLAYWYWDDGHLDESGMASFALGDVTEEVAEAIAEIVGKQFSLDIYVKSWIDTCKLLVVRSKSTDLFFYQIREFATEDMLYKMPKKHWPQGLLPRNLPLTKEVHALPKGLMQRCGTWSDLDPTDQDLLLTDLVVYWHQQGFPHPIPRPEEIGVVQALVVDQVIQDGVIKNRQVGQASCQAHTNHIWQARSYGSPYSPYDIFQDAKLLKSALSMVLGQGRVPNGSVLRSAIRLSRRSGVYNFRPSAAKVLVDKFCASGGVVWDPCAGYGGRLFGSVLSKSMVRYIACEPQSETYARLHHLRDWLGSYVPDVTSRVELHNVPAEDFEPPSGLSMVFTSPPYWRREVYGDEPTQSGIRYSTYSAWLSGFWQVVLEKAAKALRSGGWLVLNVDNFKLEGCEYDLIGDTTQIVHTLGFGDPEVLIYAMPSPGNTDNAESVLCWPKRSGVVVAQPIEPIASLSVLSCQVCGKPTSITSLDSGSCIKCHTVHKKICDGCGVSFVSSRSDNRFHDVACYARYKRAKHREVVPAKTSRVFTCCACGNQWETELLGRFKTCPACVEAKQEARRTKTCSYRLCGDTFKDTSRQNSMDYCCPEHSRREKMFRSGLAKDESYFRKKSV